MSNRPLRVLVIPAWYFQAGTSSIAGMMFQEHALELRKMGVEAQIAYPGYSAKTFRATKTTFSIERGVPTWRGEGWCPPKLNGFFINRWIRLCSQAILKHFKGDSQPDIIHARSYQAAWIAAYIHRQTGIPYIVTEHFSGFLRHEIPSFHVPFIRSAFDHAKMITAVSPGLGDEMKTFTDSAITIMPNGYNPDYFFPETHRDPSTYFQWLTVGEPMHTKGLDLLLEAFSMVVTSRPGMDFRLVLADNIPEQAYLEEMARRLDISEKIDFPGLLNPPDLAALMRNSQAVVSASRYETFGKTMVEANACGIPVVATRTAGSSYILQSTKQGFLCEPGSATALSSAMVQMVDQYSTFIGEEIHRAVNARFNKEHLMKQWINLYTRCIYDS